MGEKGNETTNEVIPPSVRPQGSQEETSKGLCVLNGKAQHGAGETYVPTPSRIEMYVLLEVVVRKGWAIAHVDESRIFEYFV